MAQAHVIDTPARGRLSFAIPQFAEYLADANARLS